MERTPCFGRCPVYTIELKASGELIYTGKQNTSRTGTYKGRISAQQMTTFLKKINNPRISKTPARFKPVSTDLPYLHFQFTLGGKLKSIRNAESGPKFLQDIARRIDSLSNAVEWIPETPVSGEGPVLDLMVDSQQNVDVAPPTTKPEVFEFVEQMPEFPGGTEALMNYLRKSLRYPETARENNIQGKVIVQFVIDEVGEVSQAKVLRGIGHGCDEEALRVVLSMPSWKPGKQNGKPVKTRMNLPISFVLK